MATDMRPDRGPLGDAPKGGVNKKAPGSVLTSFRLDSEPEKGDKPGGREGDREDRVLRLFKLQV